MGFRRTLGGIARGVAIGVLLVVAGTALFDAALGSGPALPARSDLALAGGAVVLLGLFAARSWSEGASEPVTRSDDEPAPRVGDHYRTVGTDYRDGVYRVVGTGGDVAALRVTDADGRRRHTGALVHVPRAVLDDAFEPAGNPDAGFSPVRTAQNRLDGLYWSVRRFF